MKKCLQYLKDLHVQVFQFKGQPQKDSYGFKVKKEHSVLLHCAL